MSPARDLRERVNAIAEYLMMIRARAYEGRLARVPADAERHLLDAERSLGHFDDVMAKIDARRGGVGGRYTLTLAPVQADPRKAKGS